MKTIKYKIKEPFRFSTIENAEEFMKGYASGKPDFSLPILPYIKKPEGIFINPYYVSAPYELAIIQKIKDNAEIPMGFELVNGGN
jgi:hypothetical protein